MYQMPIEVKNIKNTDICVPELQKRWQHLLHTILQCQQPFLCAWFKSVLMLTIRLHT